MYLGDLFTIGVAIIILALIDFVLEFLVIRKMKDKRESIKMRVAIRYILVIFLIVLMAKIWVKGFGYFLTVIGVVAAGFTITQKEYLMNFVGWLIIMWRALFVEGDFIEIGKYAGYVTHIGPMYFFVAETIEGTKTGCTIKLHNSIIATTPIINHSMDRGMLEGRQYFVFSYGSAQSALDTLMEDITYQLKMCFETLNPERMHRQQRDYARQKKDDLIVQCYLRVVQNSDKACGLQLKVSYYALKQEQKLINDLIYSIVKSAVDSKPDLRLSGSMT